jgi:ABC-2 type transport system ATP-binding protein
MVVAEAKTPLAGFVIAERVTPDAIYRDSILSSSTAANEGRSAMHHDSEPDLDAAISLRGLSKTYAAHKSNTAKKALGGITLDIPRGAIFGLLGPNGAGKSTLINILAGMVNKSGGRAVVWGHDMDDAPRKARSALGVVPQELNVDPFFTPRESLEFQAGYYGVKKADRRTDEILHAVGLSDQANSYARTLSGGMKRRLLVAKALVHRPSVLILDEPTAGVDIELRRQLWTYVRQLHREGATIVLTTHYLEEAEELCDRIAIINHGALVAVDSTHNLLKRMNMKTLVIAPVEPLLSVPAALSGFEADLRPDGALAIRYRKDEQSVAEIIERYTEAGARIGDLRTEEPDLEDVFLALTETKS